MVEVGGGIRTYRCDGEDVIDGYAADEMCSGGRGQILAPWPNRLGDGSFGWDGFEFQLPLDEPEHSNAIHGLVRWAPWSLEDRAASWLRMGCRLRPRPGWPWPLRMAATYSLGEAGLQVDFTATNEGGAGPCPFGVGWHPYIAAFGGPVDDLVLSLPADTAYTSDDRGLPTGTRPVGEMSVDFREGRRVGDARIDTSFTGLNRSGDGRATVGIRGPSDRFVELWMGVSYTHVMVYTGDTLSDRTRRRRAIAVEPMTCAPDMLRNGDGLLRLDEGQTFQGFWGLSKLKF